MAEAHDPVPVPVPEPSPALVQQPESGSESVEDVQARHRREAKELRNKVTALRHSFKKNDKKAKQAAMIEIARLEAELSERHEREFAAANAAPDVAAGAEETPQPAGAPGGGKQSRAAKRRAAKAAAEQERERRIAEAKDGLVTERMLENEALEQLLAGHDKRIHQVPADGHCLYNALAHQLALQHKDPGPDGYLVLRRKAAEYLAAHRDDFMPFLVGEDGDTISPEGYDKHVADVADTAMWGGATEIRALSHVLQAPIVVHQAVGAEQVIGEEYRAEPLHVTFHRHMLASGEHYNSVVNKEAEEAYQSA